MLSGIQSGSDDCSGCSRLTCEWHSRQILPESLQGIHAAKQSGEDSGVCEEDISRPLAVWRHPEERVEFCISRCGEWMRPLEVNRLLCEDVNQAVFIAGYRVMRQVWMEVEGGHSVQEAQRIQVLIYGERRNLFCAFNGRGTKSVLIDNRHRKPLHQRSSVLSKPLLAWDECIAMVRVLELSLLHVLSETHVMMRANEKARSFTLEPLAYRGDLAGAPACCSETR